MSKRDEQIAEVQAILKEARKTATPEHQQRIDGSLNWADYEQGRETRGAVRGMDRDL